MTTTLEKPSSYASLPWSSLDDAISGDLLLPDSPGYDEARHVWNGAIDKRPAMIVRAAGTDDVVRTVRFAASEGNIHETPIAAGKRRSDHSPWTNPGRARPRRAMGDSVRPLSHCSIARLPVGTLASTRMRLRREPGAPAWPR